MGLKEKIAFYPKIGIIIVIGVLVLTNFITANKQNFISKKGIATVEIHSDYLSGLGHPEPLKCLLDHIEKKLKRRKVVDKFDTIIYTGLSGAVVAIPLAQRLGKTLCCVRKEKSHSSHQLEGILGKKSLVIDDFVESGKTLEYIFNKTKDRTQITHVVLYACRIGKTHTIAKCKSIFNLRPIFMDKRFFTRVDKKWNTIKKKKDIKYGTYLAYSPPKSVS